MERVRLGIVGMGPRGRLGWIKTLQLVEHVQVVAVCDRIEHLAREGATLAGLGHENAHPDLDDLLGRPDVDAIALAVETEYQTEILLRCLAAGKHVICEVPLAYSVEDCWRIILAVERSGLTLAMAEECSYSSFVYAWRRLIEDGHLGKITLGEAQYVHGMTQDRYWIDGTTGKRLFWEEARANPNARKTRMWNIHHPIWYSPHSLGPLLRILDDRVTKVSCLATRRPSYYLDQVPLPDLEVALMHTAGDTILRLAAGFVAPSARPYLWWHLLGTLGEVETNRHRLDGVGASNVGAKLWLADHYMQTPAEITWNFTDYQPGAPIDAVRARQIAATGHGGLDYFPVEDFVRSILDGHRPAVDVYRAAEIAAASVVAGLSAEQGGALLSVPDVRPGPERAPGQSPGQGVASRR
jgi:predicted dehydrogenase